MVRDAPVASGRRQWPAILPSRIATSVTRSTSLAGSTTWPPMRRVVGRSCCADMAGWAPPVGWERSRCCRRIPNPRARQEPPCGHSVDPNLSGRFQRIVLADDPGTNHLDRAITSADDLPASFSWISRAEYQARRQWGDRRTARPPGAACPARARRRAPPQQVRPAGVEVCPVSVAQSLVLPGRIVGRPSASPSCRGPV